MKRHLFFQDNKPNSGFSVKDRNPISHQ